MIQAWSTSRSGFAFLRGMPALGILLLAPILCWAFDRYYKKVSLGPASGYHQYYRANNEFEDAVMFSEKMMQLEPKISQFKFYHAQNLYSIPERREEGERMMEWIARGEDGVEVSKGIAEKNSVFQSQANVWLSQQVLGKQARLGFTDERNELAMKYLEAASSDDIQAKRNLAELFLTRAKKIKETDPQGFQENLKSAKKELNDLTQPEHFSNLIQVQAMPKLIWINRELGKDQDALGDFQAARRKIGRLTEFKTDMIPLWITMIQCAIGVKDYDAAIEIMEEAYRTVKTPESRKQIAKLASLIYLTKADDYKDLDDQDSFRERLYALCLAIRTNPGELETYKRLIDYIDVNQGSEVRDVWLRNMTSNSPSPHVVHVLLGMRNLVKGNIVEARARWNIAKNQFAANSIIGNLLDVAIRQKREIGSPELVSKTLELLPKQYSLYQTRGNAFRNAKDYPNAIKDYELSLEKFFVGETDKQKLSAMIVRVFLIDCYEKVGNGEKAAIHRSSIDTQMAKLPEDQREVTQRVLTNVRDSL